MKYVSWKKDKRNFNIMNNNNTNTNNNNNATNVVANKTGDGCTLHSVAHPLANKKTTGAQTNSSSAHTIHYVTSGANCKKIKNEVCHIDTTNTCVVVLRGVHMINA